MWIRDRYQRRVHGRFKLHLISVFQMLFPEQAVPAAGARGTTVPTKAVVVTRQVQLAERHSGKRVNIVAMANATGLVAISPEERLRLEKLAAESAAAQTNGHAPKRIVGYSGHVPGAIERFGENFQKVDAAVPLVDKKDGLPDPPPPLEDELKRPSLTFARTSDAAITRNANRHTYKLE
eukprot:NODE_2262_length_640_cov_223.401015_g1913_i0.p1 GENE.NODE_2262_length_640_cov_223.401015_g1913_i0~~NODE_2262_length_640_cov_223.401015_g1913_i0.p1  ORF type:complete len:179 (-),score=24.86 NODE_2262_length_640_cov_223.401015_g1913_i0:104-640(-)